MRARNIGLACVLTLFSAVLCGACVAEVDDTRTATVAEPISVEEATEDDATLKKDVGVAESAVEVIGSSSWRTRRCLRRCQNQFEYCRWSSYGHSRQFCRRQLRRCATFCVNYSDDGHDGYDYYDDGYDDLDEAKLTRE